MNTNRYAVGIDLGTTNSCVGVWLKLQNTVEIITNEQGNRTTPSMVAFTATESLVGQPAMNQVMSNPNNTVFDAKRIIGKNFSDPCIQSDIPLWPFSVVSGSGGKPSIQVTFKNRIETFSAEQISSMILMRMKKMAENFLGSKVDKAVITVPAYFNYSQRQATKDAAKIAGLQVLRLLNEPSAAAIAYGLLKKSKRPENILVYDLGGGTFDVAVLTVQNEKVQVRAVGGDTHLGGQDFDSRLVEYFAKEFNRKHGKNISANPKALRRLRDVCERAKRELSCSVEAIVEVPCVHEGEDLCFTLTRAKFEQLNKDLFDKTIALVKQCLADSNMTVNNINSIVLIGGSSRIPKVEQLLRDLFGGGGGKFFRRINPDEAVAYGAAIKAATMTGIRPNHVAVTEVVPLSLGITTLGDIMSTIIPRNAPIPVTQECYYATTEDSQTSAEIKIYEGERTKASDNLLLDVVSLEGVIPPALKAQEGLTVTMHVDANGILTVTATHKKSKAGMKQVVINRSIPIDQLPAGAIEDMILQAGKRRLADEAWKEAALLCNQLDDEIYKPRKILESFTKLMESKRSAATQQVDDSRDLDNLLQEAATWLQENRNVAAREQISAWIAKVKGSVPEAMLEHSNPKKSLSKKICGIFNSKMKI